ncbi:PREDICTED: uncharacterized protein LOC107358647, partial [Acropora digitifera]|uniref:uncharacterized protein LOC107358647 n=1 Tax=Acropora digitifera TaxID=70779 RepID=UPI00077AAC81
FDSITDSLSVNYVRKLINLRLFCFYQFILTPGPAEELPVKVPPLIAAIRSNRYVHVKELYIWDVPMKHEDIATLALLLEQSIYPIQYLELMDCSINSHGVDRLGRSMCMSNLTAILLDYNRFGDEGCSGLCRGLQNNRTLLRLSLNYCALGPSSGEVLGKTVSNTALRYNNGSRDLNTELNNIFHSARSRLSSFGKKGKKGKKKKSGKKKKDPPPPPPVGPWIQKLHLMNNGIDAHGLGSTLGPVMCMKMFRKLITHSQALQELDLDDNLIGDLGGREILEALMDRKEAGLDNVKINVTHRMNSTTFATINKLGSGLKKKSKKKKGKPGKKRI